MAVKIVTDSTATLTKEQIDQYDLRQVTLFIVQDGKAEPEIDMDVHEYYKRLMDLENLPTTSQPTTASMVEAFEEILDQGNDVLGIFVSGALSGTLDGARTAASIIEERRPEAKGRIALVNSQSNGMALTYPVIEAATLAQEGASLEECREIAEYVSSCTRFLFAPKSLEHLARGGRIGRASALLGTALKLCPILGPDKVTGAVHTYAKVRTYPKALNTIKDKMLADIEASGGLKGLCVHYIPNREEGEKFLKEVLLPAIQAKYPKMEVPLFPIKPTIGTHVGPAIGLVYWTSNPMIKENVGGMGLAESAKGKLSERVQELRAKRS